MSEVDDAIDQIESHAALDREQRLRAEIERLTADLAAMSNAYAEISRIVGRQGTEKESLADQVRAEIERLRLRVKDLEINSPAQAALDEIERLTAALNGVLAREMEWAGHQGLSDCRCINLSRDAEREYETGTCPHQKARRALEGK